MNEPRAPAAVTGLDPETAAFYRHALELVQAAGVPVLVGGAYAFAIYTGIARHTKDFDVFVRRVDYDRVARILGDAGYDSHLAFPHWLGKIYDGACYVDLIFGSGNGTCPVDDAWFEHSVEADVLGVPTRIVPAEEMLWSKAFIMERERYDGADIAHVLRARAGVLDWARLLRRFGPNWRVLLSHLVLFGFVYPAELAAVPAWVLDELCDRLRHETATPPPADSVCRGTLLSREQYLHDVLKEGYTDARLASGAMSAEDIALWTEAIADRRADHS